MKNEECQSFQFPSTTTVVPVRCSCTGGVCWVLGMIGEGISTGSVVTATVEFKRVLYVIASNMYKY